jgi:hypothetical protein
MSDALATLSDNRTKRRGSNWGISPALERSRASREPKPQKPVASIKPAPVEVPTLSSLPPDAIFRIVMDLEALQDAFADRISDLGVPLTEIDAVAGMTRGQAQKVLSKSGARWCREFGWKTLGAMLRGTGLKLVLVVDDERFAPIREQMVRRRLKPKRREQKLLAPPSPPA